MSSFYDAVLSKLVFVWSSHLWTCTKLGLTENMLFLDFILNISFFLISFLIYFYPIIFSLRCLCSGLIKMDFCFTVLWKVFFFFFSVEYLSREPASTSDLLFKPNKYFVHSLLVSFVLMWHLSSFRYLLNQIKKIFILFGHLILAS